MTTTPKPTQELAIRSQSQPPSICGDYTAFENAQRVAMALSKSTMIPKEYQGNVANVLVALEMANRTGSSPLMVMQNLNIIHGKPSWASTYIIASIQSCGKFGPLRYKSSGTGDKKTVIAVATELHSGELLEGPPVSIEMAKKEGWYSRSGSKWPNMEDLMLRYRAATFFGRLYAPEIMMGMHTEDEVIDITPAPIRNQAIDNLNAKAEPSATVTQEATVVSEDTKEEEPLL